MAYLPVPNQSVSGTVEVDSIPSIYGNVSGSVVSFLNSTNASVITVGQSSIAVNIIAGSIAASFTPPANQSVSGTVLVNNGSVVAFQGTTPWLIGSVYGNISGSVAATITNTNINVSGSVVAFLGNSTNASVITVGTAVANQSVSGTVNVAGNPSISGTVNIGNNASVSGVVGASVIGVAILTDQDNVTSGNAGLLEMAQMNVFNGTKWDRLRGNSSIGAFVHVGAGSVISYIQNSIAAVIIGGSVATATTNSSVMLLNGANAIGSVTALQGTNPWAISGGNSSLIVLVQGSVATTAVAAANQSVSGTVGASIVGQLPAGTAPLGSVATLQGTNPWVIVGSVYGNISGSVVATITGTPSISGAVTIVGSSIPNGSVSGTVGASVIGIAPVTLTANTAPASALAFLGATTSITAANTSVVTVTGYPQATLQIVSNPSMTGTIIFEGSADNASWVPITGYNQATNALASVTTSADANWAFNTAGLQTFRARLSAWTAGSITGKVYLSPADARPFSQYVVGNPSISGTVLLGTGAAVIGSVAVLQGTNPWIETFSNSSIIAINAGSVVALSSGSVITLNQGSSILSVPVGSTIAVLQSSSILSVPVGSTITVWKDSSVLAVQSGTVISSVVNSIPTSLQTAIYAQRNDAVASALGADLTWRPLVTDSAGRTVIKPFAADDTAAFRYQGSVVSGSVTLIQASAIGKKSYVTDFFVANTGSVATLVTFKDGSTSILGNTIAPAGGGSNAPGFAMPFRTNVSQDLTFTVATSTSVLYMTVQGYQAP